MVVKVLFRRGNTIVVDSHLILKRNLVHLPDRISPSIG